MKILIYSLLFAIVSAILVYLFITLRDNKKYKRKIELMEYQISVVNRLLDQQDCSISGDHKIYEEADDSMNTEDEETLIYYSKMENLLDACIVIDSNKNIKYIGFYKP